MPLNKKTKLFLFVFYLWHLSVPCVRIKDSFYLPWVSDLQVFIPDKVGQLEEESTALDFRLKHCIS